MNDLKVRAMLAGLAFGLWPLFMNRSRLNGNMSSLAFGAVATLVVLPVALTSARGAAAVADWKMVMIAGVLGACGLLFFNAVLAKAVPTEVGKLFVLMVVVQISVPALYQVIMSRHLSLATACGFAAAVLAACLLA
jgi:hypothetical protein